MKVQQELRDAIKMLINTYREVAKLINNKSNSNCELELKRLYTCKIAIRAIYKYRHEKLNGYASDYP